MISLTSRWRTTSDEVRRQNTTTEQMKMFLTRLGFGSRMVITGDATQVDLPGGTQSGLRVIEDVLTGVDDVEFCRLTSSDVVRHRLVSDIIDAYARWDVATAGRERSGPRRDDRGGRARSGAGGGRARREDHHTDEQAGER